MPTIITSAAELIRTYNVRNHIVVKNSNNPFDGQINQQVTRDPELYKSPLGTPVHTDLTLGSKIYPNSYIDKNTGKTISFQAVTLITVLISVSLDKKIIRTEIPDRDGTQKEYVGTDDFQVSINGTLNGPNGKYPVDDVRALKAILDCPTPIEVTNLFLNTLDIHTIIIKDYNFDQEAGGYSSQKFSITAISDTPIELQMSGM
jgi:Domain of unknown function (DUF6046)